MWRLARQPRWIGALILALAIAAGFAALGQWQLSRAVSTGTVVPAEAEAAAPLESLAKPQQPLNGKADSRVVTVSGSWVSGDFSLLRDRINRGERGFWLVGHLVTPDGASLAVGLGWAATRAAANQAMADARLDSDRRSGTIDLRGRYIASEPPDDTDFETGLPQAMSVPALVNTWPKVSRVYNGYLVSFDRFASLDLIDSPSPKAQQTLNLLNIFYAAEWAIFAGFAVFLWYRLLRDAWERELEELAEIRA